MTTVNQAQTNQSPASLADMLANYAFVYEQKVAWGDMDAFEHVNNVMYYRYIESARIMYMSQLALLAGQVHSVVYKNSCRYLSPVLYPDTLSVGMQVTEMRNSAFRMSYHLYSHAQQKLVAEAEAVVVTIDSSTGEKCPIPDDIRKKMIAFEAQKNHEVVVR